MTRYLLDTNALSDVIRNPSGAIAKRLEKVGEESVCTSIVVAAELRYGAAKRGAERLTRRVEQLLSQLDVLAFDVPADAAYGQVRTQLEKSGTPIGGLDLLIASHALSLGYVVVTDNEREFSRVEGLRIENWLRG